MRESGLANTHSRNWNRKESKMELKIQYVSPESLVPAEYNPRKIEAPALKALARLMDAHGFVDPVIARRSDSLILGGHQRLKANALRRTPDELVPVVFLDRISDDRAKALNVALNNPQAQGHYDLEALAALLAELDLAGLKVEELTGFEPEHVADLIGGIDCEALSPACELEVTNSSGEGTGADGQAMRPDVVVVFELDQRQYAAAREHFDHLIDAHDLPCHVRFEDQQ